MSLYLGGLLGLPFLVRGETGGGWFTNPGFTFRYMVRCPIFARSWERDQYIQFTIRSLSDSNNFAKNHATFLEADRFVTPFQEIELKMPLVVLLTQVHDSWSKEIFLSETTLNKTEQTKRLDKTFLTHTRADNKPTHPTKIVGFYCNLLIQRVLLQNFQRWSLSNVCPKPSDGCFHFCCCFPKPHISHSLRITELTWPKFHTYSIL